MPVGGTQGDLRYPDFLCIGAQKAGTSWLNANLRRHSGVWLPWIKELQYFNEVHMPAHQAWTVPHRRTQAQGAIRRTIRAAGEGPVDLVELQGILRVALDPVSDEWYGRIFAQALPEQACGEVTPAYGLLPRAGVEHVRRLNPRMRIILLLREPVARCWSHIRMLSQGRPDFDFLAAAEQRDVLARADYPRIIDAWSAVFGRDAMLIRKIEDVSRDSGRFWHDLSAFLGIPWHPEPERRAAAPVFVGPELAMPPAVERLLRERLAPICERMGDYDAYRP